MLVIGFIYLIFDVFNKRNIPSVIVYSFLGYGILLTVLYLNLNRIIESSLIAIAIISFGYIIYKLGLLGFGDIFELATLSLIFPFFNKPIFYSLSQFNIPFVISILLNSGIVAIILIPIFYLIKFTHKHKNEKISIFKLVTNKQIFKTLLIAISYSIFIAFLIILFGFYNGFIILILIATFSVIMILFELPITNTMIEYVSVNKFEEGELIAINLMADNEVKKIKKQFKSFNRLITFQLIKQMKQKHFKKKLPIYKEPIPFATMIFLGIILSIGIGNLLFFIIPLH